MTKIKMCLSNVVRQNDNELIMKNTSSIVPDGNELIIRDLFGDEKRISGTIVSLDFEKNEVVIRCPEE